MVFDIKGWTKVVAFHTRSVPHRGHEHIILGAAARCNADGILIHPVVGPKMHGGFTPGAIMGAYERLISARVPNALLAAFSTYSRYSGPRGAVFAALCRKNFGCTHFILGCDHAGHGSLSASNANRDLFESLGDIGITPVFFDPIHFSSEAGDTVESPMLNGHRVLSGDLVRDLLGRDQPIPEWCMRSDIAGLLTDMRRDGRPVFVDEADRRASSAGRGR